MRGGRSISIALLDAPFASPLHHLAVESALSQGRDDEPALAEGGIGVRVAVPAQGDQPVEVEVRAPFGALGYLVHIKTGPATASLKAKRARAKTWAPVGSPPTRARRRVLYNLRSRQPPRSPYRVTRET